MEASNVSRVQDALTAAGHVRARSRSGGFTAFHVQGTKGDVGVQAVGTGRNQAHHVQYVVSLAKAFPQASVAIEHGLLNQRHVFVRFPNEGAL